jgi:hypothetical protein
MFTEEILIPCSCDGFKEESNDFQTKAIFLLVGLFVGFFLMSLILIMAKRLTRNNIKVERVFLILQNGKDVSK